MSKEVSKRKIHRDAGTGRFVTEDYAKKHPIKVKMIEKMKNNVAGTTEEYSENPLRLIITMKNDKLFNLNRLMYISQIELKLNTLMKRYNVAKTDYVIEVL